ncbi:immunoglobulin domain-containing protein [Bengtsoniella intestinalis]|uniref:immunoglobulin domain-containing protein n=1 Tax=Bengtsoniella intestinalis TaxID=3073143 RepID=UPI00391F046C
MFTLSNVNLTLKNGYVLAGAGGNGGDGGDGGSSSSYYPGDGKDGADGGDCITITSKSTITLDGVTLSAGNGGSPGAGGTVYYTSSLVSVTLWRNGEFGEPGAGGTAIQGPMELTLNNSTVTAGKATQTVTNYSYGYNTKVNISGFAIYANSGSNITADGSTISGYSTTIIWSENTSIYMYDSKVSAGYVYGSYGSSQTMTSAYTTDHSGEAIKMTGTSNILYLDDVYLTNERYDNNAVKSASAINITNATATLQNVTIYGVKHAIEANNSTVEITNGKLYVDLDYKVLYYGLESDYPCDAIGSTNSTITIHSGTIKGDSYTTGGVTYTSCTGDFIVGADSEVTERVWANTSTAGYCVVAITDIPPVIATQPQSTTVVAGSTASFSVSVTEGSSPVTYQWYYNTTGNNDGTGTAAGTSSTLSVSTTSAMNGRYYHCKITAGSTTLYTNAAKLTVTYAPTAATISRSPTTAVNAGTSITFTANVTGAGNPTSYTYQWYVGGSAVYGATSSTYTRTALSSDNGVAVYCQVSNTVGFVNSDAVLLSVYYTPTADCYASATAVTEGESITFYTVITNQGNPSTYTYQWYIGGTPIEGATASQMVYSPTVADSGKAVYCLLSSEAGVAMATPQVITVYPTVETADLITSITDISGSILGSALYKDSAGAVLVYDADGLAVTLDTTPVTGKYVAGYAEFLGQTYPVLFSNEQETDVLQTKYPSQGQFYINPAFLSTTTRSTPLNVYITMYSDESLTQAMESDSFTMYLSVDTAPPVVSFQTNSYTNECQVSARDVVAGIGAISYSIVDIDGAIRSSGASDVADFTLSLETGDVVTVTATDTVGNQGVSTSLAFVAGTGGILLPDFLFPTDLDASIYHYKTTLFDCYLVGGKYNNVD